MREIIQEELTHQLQGIYPQTVEAKSFILSEAMSIISFNLPEIYEAATLEELQDVIAEWGNEQ